MLSDHDRVMLEMAGRRWLRGGGLEQAAREQFGLTGSGSGRG